MKEIDLEQIRREALTRLQVDQVPPSPRAAKQKGAKQVEPDETETQEIKRLVQTDENVLGAGYKLDAGKPRWDLFPFDAAEEVVKVLTWACNKDLRGDKAYPSRNWERGMSWSRVFRALVSHSWKWWFAKVRGEAGVDEESGLSHMSHAFCCAAFLAAYEVRKLNQFDDRPTPPASEGKKSEQE